MHRDCDRHAPVDDPLFRSRDGHRIRHSVNIKNRKKERSDRMYIGYETHTWQKERDLGCQYIMDDSRKKDMCSACVWARQFHFLDWDGWWRKEWKEEERVVEYLSSPAASASATGISSFFSYHSWVGGRNPDKGFYTAGLWKHPTRCTVVGKSIIIEVGPEPRRVVYKVLRGLIVEGAALPAPTISTTNVLTLYKHLVLLFCGSLYRSW